MNVVGIGLFLGNIGVGIGILAGAVLLIIFAFGYVKAPTDEAFIISGIRPKPRILIGKAGLRLPFLERKDTLQLGLVQCDIKTPSAVPTNEFINIYVDAVANVKIGSDEVSLMKAAENFLAKPKTYIMEIAQQILEGNMREIIGQMTLEALVHERDTFAEKVKSNANKDMQEMGLQIVNLTIQNFYDENKVIENLGVDNVVRISKEAAISRANSEKEIAVAEAEALKIKNEAKIVTETAIAERETDLQNRKSDLKKEADIKVAIADAAYSIQQQEQRKTIEVATTEADIAKQEKAIILKQREAEVKEKELDSLIKKQADADLYAAQKKADAELYKRMREAEAKKFEKQQEAEAKRIQADADLYESEKKATGIAKIGEAEAGATKAKLLAEAEGVEKKAEAQAKMGEASVIDMFLNKLPEIAKNVAEPLTKVDKITMYGEGNTTRLVGDITNTMTKIMSGIQDATGIDVTASITERLKKKPEENPVKNDAEKSDINESEYTEVRDDENTADARTSEE